MMGALYPGLGETRELEKALRKGTFWDEPDNETMKEFCT